MARTITTGVKQNVGCAEILSIGNGTDDGSVGATDIGWDGALSTIGVGVGSGLGISGFYCDGGLRTARMGLQYVFNGMSLGFRGYSGETKLAAGNQIAVVVIFGKEEMNVQVERFLLAFD